MFCVYCGTKNPDEASICLFCGQRVHNFQTQTEAVVTQTPPAEDTAKVPVYQESEPDARTGGTIAIQKYSVATFNKQKPAPWYAAFQRHPVAVLATAALVVVGLLATISLWRWTANRAARSHYIENLLKDGGELQAKSAGFTRHIQELRNGPALSMMDYHDQCLGLEPLLNDASSTTEKGEVLVDQAIPEFQDDPKIFPVLNDMKKALGLDKRLQTDVKQETLLVKTLMHLEPNEQTEFFAMSIKPLQDEEKQLASEEQQTLAQIQNEGRQLPSNLSRSLLSQ
jgi:hypothetical protein